MAGTSYLRLSRRERQIMDIIYRRGEATAAEVQADLPKPPTNAAVRAKLRVLEEKGYLHHVQDGPRYIYRPLLEQAQAQETALAHIMQTFFAGSTEQVVAALLRLRRAELSEAELDRLADLVEQHRPEED